LIGVPFKAADLVGLAGEVGQNAAAGEAFLGGDARPLDLTTLEEVSWVLAVRLRVTLLGWRGLLELVLPFEGSFGSGPSEL
jgi:hypothetical protein